MFLTLLFGWLDRQERDALRYLLEENRVLRRQLKGRRLQLTDDDRRGLAARAYQLGRTRLREIATVVTPDTLLRWHRQLIARKWTHARRCPSRVGVLTEIRRLTVRMAEENPTWGYTRIQGALKNVGHRVGRSTIARILKVAGVPPQPERPTSWQTFLRAHWGVIAGADFFTTEVWTSCGLVTYYTVFVIDLASRRVRILGSTPHPDERGTHPGHRRAQVAQSSIRLSADCASSRTHSGPTGGLTTNSRRTGLQTSRDRDPGHGSAHLLVRRAFAGSPGFAARRTRPVASPWLPQVGCLHHRVRTACRLNSVARRKCSLSDRRACWCSTSVELQHGPLLSQHACRRGPRD
jgi:hypothetical protein